MFLVFGNGEILRGYILSICEAVFSRWMCQFVLSYEFSDASCSAMIFLMSNISVLIQCSGEYGFFFEIGGSGEKWFDNSTGPINKV